MPAMWCFATYSRSARATSAHGKKMSLSWKLKSATFPFEFRPLESISPDCAISDLSSFPNDLVSEIASRFPCDGEVKQRAQPRARSAASRARAGVAGRSVHRLG